MHQLGLEYAQKMDQNDSLKAYRKEFLFPQHDGKDTIYLCGNSLGLQPRGVRQALINELDHWEEHGVEGHFRGDMPWMYYHKFLQEQCAHIVGANKEEVVVMNTLTANLHLMMVSFYRPTASRYKIVMAAGSFPSDQYAVESQVKFHGFLPENAIVEVAPREGDNNLHTEDILATIREHGDEVALVLFSGVNYFTGQFFDIPAITKVAHEVGALAGFDLAHAAGNVPLQLHDWGCDFAVWCSYKYLNSGPGGPSGVFVHERHGNNPNTPRFAGWWGYEESTRFLMRKGFKPELGAAGWQMSNVPIFSCAANKVSLDIFYEATIPALRAKSELLTGYMEFLIDDVNKEKEHYKIITPRDPEQRGCQLSIYVAKDGKELFDYLADNGVICDWREDNMYGEGGGVIRVAAVPLYCSFEDVYNFVDLLRKAC